MAALVGEPNLERLHQVVGRDVLDLALFEHAYGCGEAAPAVREPIAKLLDVVIDAQLPRPRGVEVGV